MKPPRSEFWLPLALIMLLSAVIAGPELLNAGAPRNDALLHIHQVERMDQAFRQGQALLDHWDPTIGLGYPFPRTYACGTHVLLWALWRLTALDLTTLYGLLTLLGWTLWPLSVFFGLRQIGQSPSQALAAAWLAPYLHTGFRFGIAPESYFWLGYGLLPNLLGLILFPIALGLGHRYLLEGRNLLGFVATLSLTFFTHLIMGYVAVLSLLILMLAGMPHWRPQSRSVLTRLAGSGLATLGTCLFFLWPYLADHRIINHSRFEPKAYWDGYPAAEVIKAALTGQLLDFHLPLPVISLLALAGLIYALRTWRSALPVVLVFTFWFAVYLGRTQWNPLVWLLPMADNLPLERAIVPLQFFALALAGQALALLLDLRPGSGSRWVLKWCLVPLLLLGFHLARNIAQNLLHASRFKDQHATQAELGPELEAIGQLLYQGQDGGRLLVPADRSLKLGTRGFFEIPLILDLPHVGNLWHSMSLNSDFLYEIRPERLDHWQLFGLKYGLGPTGGWANGALQTLTRSSTYELTRNPAYGGLFDFGQISEVLPGSPSDHYERVVAWMMSEGPAKGDYLGFTLGAKVWPGPVASPAAESGFTYKVRQVEQDHFGYQLRTRSRSNGYLIAKITWHPRWIAEVDDQATAIVMVSPSLMAIPLAAGEHQVSLRYRPSPWRPWLMVLSALLLAGCGWQTLRTRPPMEKTTEPSKALSRKKYSGPGKTKQASTL